MSDASFKSVLARIDRSIARQSRVLVDLAAQRAAIAPRVAEAAYAALDRRLEAHGSRVRASLDALQFERQAVAELVAKSPELPLASQSKKR